MNFWRLHVFRLHRGEAASPFDAAVGLAQILGVVDVLIVREPFDRQHSATGHFLQLFGITSPLHHDLGGSVVDFTEIVGSEFDGDCPDVLIQAM